MATQTTGLVIQLASVSTTGCGGLTGGVGEAAFAGGCSCGAAPVGVLAGVAAVSGVAAAPGVTAVLEGTAVEDGGESSACGRAAGGAAVCGRAACGTISDGCSPGDVIEGAAKGGDGAGLSDVAEDGGVTGSRVAAATGGLAIGKTAFADGSAISVSTGGGVEVAAATVGADAPCTPKACAVGTLSVVPLRNKLGFPLANASGLPASKIDIICGTLTAVEGRT